MASQKRSRDTEPVSESVASHIPKKRARIEASHVPGEICAKTSNGYSRHLLIVWSLPMSQQQKKYIASGLKDLVKLVSASDLTKPPITADLPRWAKRIKKPLDLNTMKNDLAYGKYLSVTSFVTDFKDMICNTLRIYGWDHDKSVKALTVLQWFRYRMKHCPTGPEAKPMIVFHDVEIQRMASQIKDDMIKVSESSPMNSEVISISDSDASEYDEVTNWPEAGASEGALNDADISHGKLGGNSLTTHDTKTPEPDDLDAEAQQLEREIEERQQKLANMAEKKRLLTEIKGLDTEKAAIDGQIPETKRQAEQLQTKLEDCCHKITTLNNECNGPLQASLWRQQEILRLCQQSERLQRESENCRRASEIHLREDEKLRPTVNHYLQQFTALDSEQKQVQEQSRQAIETEAQLKDKRDKLEDQRAIAKKKLDGLRSGSI